MLQTSPRRSITPPPTTVRHPTDGVEKLGLTRIHASYQLVIRSTNDGECLTFLSASLPQREYYAACGLDP